MNQNLNDMAQELAANAVAPVSTPSVINASSVIASNHTTWTTRDIARKYRLDNTGRLRTPLCQREYANQWKKQSRRHDLIDSIFHNYPLGTIILDKNYTNPDDTDANYDIYDGRHRIETVARFVNNEFKYKGLLYRDLSASDRRIFDDRKIPVTEIEFAQDTPQQTRSGLLAEIFIRLNKGVRLTDSDLCWANRDMPLVRETLLMLDRYEERLGGIFGGFDVKNRKNLDNWVALCLGLSTGNAANITTSYVRIAEFIQTEPNVAAIDSGMNTLIELYTTANTESPVSQKELRKYAKTGFVNAFFFADLLLPENAAADGAVVGRWLDIIRRLRDVGRSAAMTAAIKTTGAQNLNAIKISRVLDQIRRYFAGEGIVPEADVDESEDESD